MADYVITSPLCTKSRVARHLERERSDLGEASFALPDPPTIEAIYHSETCIVSCNMSSDWELYITPNLSEIVQKLNPTLLMERLRSCGVLTAEDCSSLRNGCSTEEERSRKLLHDILPRRGNDVFNQFCRILLTVEGQNHIVTQVMKVPSAHRARTQLQHVQPEESPLDPESSQRVCECVKVIDTVESIQTL